MAAFTFARADLWREDSEGKGKREERRTGETRRGDM